MTAYEELLEFGGERIFDFLKNARLHESQFKYSEFNEVCYKKMYIENNQDSIKTVKELKEEIPELKDTCKGCGSYFMNPRNKSIKGLDVQFGRLLEDVIIDFLKTKYKLNVTHGDNSNKKYPDCMLLSGDKGILAYFEVKYHGAPFISAINKIGRYCYEGSATVHGKTPDDYKACANYILELEKKYNYRFWGFALGGIASYKKLDKSWFDGISFKNLNKNDFAPLVGPAIASRIVRSLDKEGLYMRWGAVDIQTLYLITFVEQLRLMQPRQQDVFVMETKILQHWFILRYITKRASQDSVNTLLVDLMLMVVKEKKIQII